MNLSTNFTLEEATFSETAVRMGIPNEPSSEQLENMKKAAEGMEAIRKLLGKPIRVSSWLRLPAVNQAIGSIISSLTLMMQLLTWLQGHWAFLSSLQLFDQ